MSGYTDSVRLRFSIQIENDLESPRRAQRSRNESEPEIASNRNCDISTSLTTRRWIQLTRLPSCYQCSFIWIQRLLRLFVKNKTCPQMNEWSQIMVGTDASKLFVPNQSVHILINLSSGIRYLIIKFFFHMVTQESRDLAVFSFFHQF
jgi:hypothetical protein